MAKEWRDQSVKRGLAKVRKELVGRFYQLHAAMAEHLVKLGQATNDRCWWCGSGETDKIPPLRETPTLGTGD